jgi:hypothetical protein
MMARKRGEQITVNGTHLLIPYSLGGAFLRESLTSTAGYPCECCKREKNVRMEGILRGEGGRHTPSLDGKW